ncbi:MAG: HlyD family efflux transporter periplasmic adaptor subunit [Phycisphaerales bacterium]|nr:HlyD family efflux transporter periplasmic adaptor subunit [Phycisphaerales bacterium]NNM27471.1 HlyD family efflux transporter periplasmic adaptor subunit [Phycisphaerales bacterium]
MPVWLRRAFIGVVGLAILAALIWAFRPTPVPVDTALVRRGALAVTVDEDGRTRIKERYVVSSPLGGRLRRIQLDPGDPITEGETVLAVIEPTDPRLLDARERAEAEARVRAATAAVRRADAERESARAAYDFAEDELSRVREMLARGGGTPRELEQQETNHRTAMEAFRAARFAEEIAAFELQLAESALLLTRADDGGEAATRFAITAPISGRVLRVLQESVAVVQPGTPLLELGNPADLEVVVDVLSTDAVKIRPGQDVIIEHWGGPRPLEAVVRVVEPSAFTKISALGVEEQRVNVVADFVSPGEERTTLGDGFRVETRIVLWRSEDEVVVPSSALFRRDPAFGVEDDDGGWALFVVDAGRVQRRPVTIGRQTGLLTQVLEGVTPGETVLVHPSDSIADGIRVAPRP